MSERPQRAVRMTLTIGADSRSAMARSLEQIAERILFNEINGPNGCSGGCDSGYSYEFTASDRPTPEEYVAQLNAYLDAGKAAGARE